uniref:Putative sumo ligase n=1 Tax=Schistosoma mansoni TaxID=6183 RepID=A0A5K4EWT5_SCHMA
MRQTRDHLELKAFIQRCRRADLDKLIKLTNLPRGGLKQDIQLRLISYLDQDPSTEFLSALNELRGLMYNPVSKFFPCLQCFCSHGNLLKFHDLQICFNYIFELRILMQLIPRPIT